MQRRDPAARRRQHVRGHHDERLRGGGRDAGRHGGEGVAAVGLHQPDGETIKLRQPRHLARDRRDRTGGRGQHDRQRAGAGIGREHAEQGRCLAHPLVRADHQRRRARSRKRFPARRYPRPHRIPPAPRRPAASGRTGAPPHAARRRSADRRKRSGAPASCAANRWKPQAGNTAVRRRQGRSRYARPPRQTFGANAMKPAGTRARARP